MEEDPLVPLPSPAFSSSSRDSGSRSSASATEPPLTPFSDLHLGDTQSDRLEAGNRSPKSLAQRDNVDEDDNAISINRARDSTPPPGPSPTSFPSPSAAWNISPSRFPLSIDAESLESKPMLLTSVSAPPGSIVTASDLHLDLSVVSFDSRFDPVVEEGAGPISASSEEGPKRGFSFGTCPSAPLPLFDDDLTSSRRPSQITQLQGFMSTPTAEKGQFEYPLFPSSPGSSSTSTFRPVDQRSNYASSSRRSSLAVHSPTLSSFSPRPSITSSRRGSLPFPPSLFPSSTGGPGPSSGASFSRRSSIAHLVPSSYFPPELSTSRKPLLTRRSSSSTSTLTSLSATSISATTPKHHPSQASSTRRPSLHPITATPLMPLPTGSGVARRGSLMFQQKAVAGPIPPSLFARRGSLPSAERLFGVPSGEKRTSASGSSGPGMVGLGGTGTGGQVGGRSRRESTEGSSAVSIGGTHRTRRESAQGVEPTSPRVPVGFPRRVSASSTPGYPPSSIPEPRSASVSSTNAAPMPSSPLGRNSFSRFDTLPGIPDDQTASPTDQNSLTHPSNSYLYLQRNLRGSASATSTYSRSSTSSTGSGTGYRSSASGSAGGTISSISVLSGDGGSIGLGERGERRRGSLLSRGSKSGLSSSEENEDVPEGEDDTAGERTVGVGGDQGRGDGGVPVFSDPWE